MMIYFLDIRASDVSDYESLKWIKSIPADYGQIILEHCDTHICLAHLFKKFGVYWQDRYDQYYLIPSSGVRLLEYLTGTSTIYWCSALWEYIKFKWSEYRKKAS